MENMEFKGTKGKWVAEKSEVVRYASAGSISPYWQQICSFVASGKEAKANAQLISKAPEMLEVLQSLENDNGAIPKFMWDKIQSVIKEATTIE